MKINNKKKIFVISLTLLLILQSPILLSKNIEDTNGFDKGPSYKNVVPIKKATLVKYDEDSYIDDYAYLAAVPSAVFKDNDILYSHPLIFYQDKLDIENETEKSLDAHQGVKYFMDDWLEYSNNKLDKMTLINVREDKVREWRSREIKSIESNDIYKIANEIALDEWSYSDNVVIAVVNEDIKNQENKISDSISGTIIINDEIIEKRFETEKLNLLNPRFHEFEVPEGYKYLKSRTWWPSMYLSSGKTSDLPAFLNITIPTADPDSQIYCQYNDEWMMVAGTSEWNLNGMDKEKTGSYIYTPGQWKLGITDVPTKGKFVGIYGKLTEFLRNIIGKTKYYTDITIYPGIEYDIPTQPDIGCRDASFILTWDQDNVRLGFSIIGPAGEEVFTSTELESGEEIVLDRIGECVDDEHYKISVFTMDDTSQPIDFKLDYSWNQEYPEEEIDSLSSATEGAVLASQLNAPLLYSSTNIIDEKTTDVIYTLGVKNIYLVDIGNHLDDEVYEEIKMVAKVKKEFKTAIEIYEYITEITDNYDVIFATIDPWTKWLVTERKPFEETNAGMFLGPAAYCAAHHGSPVIIIDKHPELSSSVVWHTELWRRHGDGHEKPNIAVMYLTGSRIYDFLDKINMDQEGLETIITVAGQYDIGATWDRMFTGKAKPGRIFGSPVDASYWISHNIFYPALIFNNKAMDNGGNDLIQGSSSKRSKLFPWGSIGLKITEESKEMNFDYPVLLSFICYEHRLNEKLDKYLGFKYKSADDIIPGETESFNSIDEGITDNAIGAVYPDMSTTEVTPAYLEKGGYGNVYSTQFEPIIKNLNDGVLLWISSTHGAGQHSGQLMTWDSKDSMLASLPGLISNRFGFTKEENPWRGYEWYLGSTEEPDTLTMENHGFLAALLGNPNIDGLFPVGLDFWPSERPILHAITNLPIIKWFLPNWLKDDSYYKDGLVIASLIGSFTTSTKLTGYTLDSELENIHSCGMITSACLPAYKYLHLALVRHGSPFQVIDPWTTSWYSSFWSSTIPRDIILGDTVGEAYVKGMSHVGILYLTGQWWWDMSENVCYFGDPDQRMFVPDTTYSKANYWTIEETMPLNYDIDTNINGHMPFGATDHPNKRAPQSLFEQILPLMVLSLIIIFTIAAVIYRKKKK